jgi:hypothetical protein
MPRHELLDRTQELKADLGTWRSPRPRMRSLAPIPAPNMRLQVYDADLSRSFDHENACKAHLRDSGGRHAVTQAVVARAKSATLQGF